MFVRVHWLFQHTFSKNRDSMFVVQGPWDSALKAFRLSQTGDFEQDLCTVPAICPPEQVPWMLLLSSFNAGTKHLKRPANLAHRSKLQGPSFHSPPSRYQSVHQCRPQSQRLHRLCLPVWLPLLQCGIRMCCSGCKCCTDTAAAKLLVNKATAASSSFRQTAFCTCLFAVQCHLSLSSSLKPCQ